MNAFCFVAFTNYFQSVVGNIGFIQFIITTVNITLDFRTIFENDFIILDFFRYSTIAFRITTIDIFINSTIINSYSIIQAVAFKGITAINIFINATAICDAYNITNAIFSSITAINIHINTTMGNIYFVAIANSC